MLYVTLFDENMRAHGELCVESMTRFGRKDVQVLPFTSLIDHGRSPSWNKLIAVQCAMQCVGADEWVMWVDADCVMCNPGSVPVRLADLSWASLVTSEDSNGICMCCFAIRNTVWAQRLLQTLLFLGDVRDDSQFGTGRKWEQNALKAVLREFTRPRTLVGTFRDEVCVSDHPAEADPEYLRTFHHYGVRPLSERLLLMRQAMSITAQKHRCWNYPPA